MFPSSTSNTIMPQLTTPLASDALAQATLFSPLRTLYRNSTSLRKHLTPSYSSTRRRSSSRIPWLYMQPAHRLLQDKIQAYLGDLCRYVLLPSPIHIPPFFVWFSWELASWLIVLVDRWRSWLRDLQWVLPRNVRPGADKEAVVSKCVQHDDLYRTRHCPCN